MAQSEVILGPFSQSPYLRGLVNLLDRAANNFTECKSVFNKILRWFETSDFLFNCLYLIIPCKL